ncbi:MAG: hypothetical protein HYV63_15535 [Candidatus Schekmanbacteria bacterium]|nr:hypothetical protein [Candidatus Schekmanbacteria bacterium]
MLLALAMAVTHTNRKGKIYTLCRSPRAARTGKVRHHFALSSDEGIACDFMPEGFEVSESPNGLISLAKARPKLVRSEEARLVDEPLVKHPQSHRFRVHVAADRNEIHESTASDLNGQLTVVPNARPSYERTYHALLTTADLGGLWQLVRQTGVAAQYHLEEMRLERDEEGFPYLVCRQETPTKERVGYVAMWIGVFVDPRSLLPGYHHSELYVPFVVLPRHFDERLTGDPRVAVGHEVLHVKDVVALIERDPSYLPRMRELAINNLEDPRRLGDSVEFEVFRVFHFEARALATEYAIGENTIRIPVLFLVISYRCASRQQYLELMLANAVVNLWDEYERKLADRTDELRGHFDRALAMFGTDVFGDRVTLAHIEELCRGFWRELPAYLGRARK